MDNLKESKAFAGFSVDDTQKAKEFYHDVLGIDIAENNEMGVLHLNVAGGNSFLIYPKPNHEPATYTVLNFPVPNVEEAVAGLKSKGIQFEIYKMEGFKTDENGIFRDGGPLIAWFKDPAGNILSVIQES